MQQNTAASKGRFTAEVAANTPLNPHHYRLTLRLKGPAATAFAPTTPGQFAQFDASTLALPPTERIPHDLRDSAQRSILLRRPLSFADVRTDPSGAVIIEVLYCVLGPATLRMTTLAPGDSISVIGPLGRGYSTSASKKQALLVAGGMGAPPLQHMAAYLRQNRPDTNVLAFVGARSLQQLPYTVDHTRASREPSYALKEFMENGVMSLVATDDGSFGYKGFVTDLLAEWLTRPHVTADTTVIYTCGPEVMMSVVAKIAAQHHIDCQVSMERMMACGIGLCQSCAVECKAGSNTEYRLCCKDGPVFDSTEIAWGWH